jgi:hypothetical protein
MASGGVRFFLAGDSYFSDNLDLYFLCPLLYRTKYK